MDGWIDRSTSQKDFLGSFCCDEDRLDEYLALWQMRLGLSPFHSPPKGYSNTNKNPEAILSHIEEENERDSLVFHEIEC